MISWAGRTQARIGRRWWAIPAIDIVDICTPNDSHCEIALEAIRNGKAILLREAAGDRCRRV